MSAISVSLVAGAAGAVQLSPRNGSSEEAEEASATAGSGGETDGRPAAGQSTGAAVVVFLATPSPAGSSGGGAAVVVSLATPSPAGSSGGGPATVLPYTSTHPPTYEYL